MVGKAHEKELVKSALLSGSPILFKGKRGYGKTTFSKSIASLLPNKLLAIKDCKIYDDPTHPNCFSCKKKVLEDGEVKLVWVPRVWVRMPGDPMLTTRQLIGGISIQKIREGYDLDHPEVFIPGRALKANRGVGYFDELGAVPSSLQTLLHELFEEHQVTTMEGDIVPFKIDTIEIASTNPANYRGTSPIKEPLLDRMEEIEIGPPETLEEEMEIGWRNMYIVTHKRLPPQMPKWHLRILARTVRYARSKESCDVAKHIESEPSCRATIKLYDHVKSKALRSGREIPLLSDYGDKYQMVKLGLMGRIEIEYGAQENKSEVIEKLLEVAIKNTCKEIYALIPNLDFPGFYEELRQVGVEGEGGERYISIQPETVPALRRSPKIREIVEKVEGGDGVSDGLFLSSFEILLHSIAKCTPRYVERKGAGYIVREMSGIEA